MGGKTDLCTTCIGLGMWVTKRNIHVEVNVNVNRCLKIVHGWCSIDNTGIYI